MSFIQLSALVG